MKPPQLHQQTAVVAEIQNTKPVLANNLEIEAVGYEDGNESPIYKKTMEASFAPNSTMDFTLDEWESPLEAGEYLLKAKVNDTDSEETWTFEEGFTIEKKAAVLHAKEFE